MIVIQHCWVYPLLLGTAGFETPLCAATEDATNDAACQAPTYPSHARAICDGQHIDLPLQQENACVGSSLMAGQE